MEARSYNYRGRDVDVYSGRNVSNERFYSLLTFTELLQLKVPHMAVRRLRKIGRLLNLRLVGSTKEVGLPTKEFPQNHMFVNKFGLKVFLDNTKSANKFKINDFFRHVLSDFHDELDDSLATGVHQISYGRVLFDSIIPMNAIKISGSNIDDFFYVRPLNAVFQYTRIDKAVLKYVSLGNYQYYKAFNICRISVQEDVFSPRLSRLLKTVPVPLDHDKIDESLRIVTGLRSSALFINARGFRELFVKSNQVCTASVSLAPELLNLQEKSRNIFWAAYVAYVVDPSLFNETVVYLARGPKRYIEHLDASRKKFLDKWKTDPSVLNGELDHPVSWYFAQRYYLRQCNTAISWQAIQNTNPNFFYGLNCVNDVNIGFTTLTYMKLVDKYNEDMLDPRRKQELMTRGIRNVPVLLETCYTRSYYIAESIEIVLNTALDELS